MRVVKNYTGMQLKDGCIITVMFMSIISLMGFLHFYRYLYRYFFKNPYLIWM